MRKRIGFVGLAMLMCLTASAAGAGDVRHFMIVADRGTPPGAAKDSSAHTQPLVNAAGLLSADIAAGVLGYGDDMKQRCANVSELAPLAPLRDTREALKAAFAVQPDKKGRAPQITAITRAAAQLKSAGTANGAIILLAHRADDCAPDPCAAAKAFHAQSPSVPVHVIALRAPAASLPKLKCIAANTGGIFQDVTDADRAGSALLAAFGAKVPDAGAKTVEAPPKASAPDSGKGETPSKANAPDAGKAETAPKTGAPDGGKGETAKNAAPAPVKEAAAPPPVRAAPPAKPQPEPNFLLRASLGEGTPPLPQGVAYRVYTGDGNGQRGKVPAPVWTGGGGESRLRLAPGKYTVEAAYGFISARQPLTVDEKAPGEMAVVLNGGTIQAEAAAKAGDAPLDHMFYIAYAGESGGKWREIGRSSQARAAFHVPAGEYKIVARHGKAEAEAAVTVAAGSVKPAKIVMNCGTLTLSARLMEGATPLAGVRYTVQPAGERREIAAATSPAPPFVLPAGRYKAVAQYELARVEKELTVAAGGDVKEDIILGGAHLTLASKAPGGSALAPREVRYVIAGLDGNSGVRIEPGAMTGLGRPLLLPAGRYRIESRYGALNAVETAEVTLASGETREQVFEHQAARIKLAVVSRGPAKLPARMQVVIKDESGAVVADLPEAPAQPLVLKPGKYQVTAKSGGKSGEAGFEAAGNDQKTVEVLVK